MAQEPTKYPAVQPLTESEGTPSRPFQAWEQRVSKSVPIVGEGSPEGVVEALQYQQYWDETTPTSPTKYIKMLTDIGGDRKKGWIDALTLSALTLDTLTVTDVYRDVTSGEGDKIGTPSSSDWGWHDITGQIEIRGVAATDPSWSQISTGPFWAHKFGLGDYVWIPYHVPHDIVPNSQIYFHTHYLVDGTDTNTVKWEWDYMYARGHQQDAFNVAGTTISVTQAPTGTAYTHMVAETTGVTISNLDEPDGIIYTRLGRVSNGGTNNSNGVFLIEADLHYQSTGIATKNKAPNFYT